MLENLRRELDKVAQDLGPGQPLVADLRQQTMEAVANS
jgi:hypothetical protein